MQEIETYDIEGPLRKYLGQRRQRINQELVTRVSQMVGSTLEGALGADAEEIGAYASLHSDLLAESIDGLDIVHRLDKAMLEETGERIHDVENAFLRLYIPGDFVDDNDVLTEKGMAEVIERYAHIITTLPEEKRQEFENNRTQGYLFQEQTVLSLAVFCYDRLRPFV